MDGLKMGFLSLVFVSVLHVIFLYLVLLWYLYERQRSGNDFLMANAGYAGIE